MVKLNLACGGVAIEGYIGIDIHKTEATDMVMDLLKFPWPFEDNSVDTIYCSHFFEHIPKELRVPFMEECYRILKVDADMKVVVPAYNSERAVMDFTHEWPPITGNSFLYFNKPWRETNKLTHGPYDIKADFKCESQAVMSEDWQTRAYDAQIFASRHYWNSVLDIIIHLKKKA